MKRFILMLAFLALSTVPAASAQQNLYLALNPDSTICDTITFGGYGKGEYTLEIDDPGYPDSPWVDIHRASFIAGPDNPVTVPLCFSTENRKNGDEAILRLRLETPEQNLSFDYGICVSEFEDADVIVSSSPCAATEQHTDIFTMDMLQKELYAKAGGIAAADLVISSDMDISVSLEKESGPSMNIEMTTVHLPGEEMVHIDMDAPSEPGDYPFAITGSVNGCDSPSCTKRVEGTLHVNEERTGFDINLAPKNRNIIGIRSATYYLTIENFEETGVFSVALDKGDGLDSDMDSMDITIAGGTKRVIGIVVIPVDTKKRLFTLRVTVQDESGKTKSETAMLTVDEAVSDAGRAAENGTLSNQSAADFGDKYESDATLDDWQDINSKIIDNTAQFNDMPESGTAFPPWLMAIAAAGIIAGVGAFYIYKKSKVTDDVDSDEYQSYM